MARIPYFKTGDAAEVNGERVVVLYPTEHGYKVAAWRPSKRAKLGGVYKQWWVEDAALSTVQLTREERIWKTNTELLVSIARENLKNLLANADLKGVQQLAFQHWDGLYNREVQVHVLATVDQSEFLEPFTTLEHV